MSWTARITAPAALTAALVVMTAPTAAAAPRPSVPPDVAAAFAGTALDRAQAGAETDPAFAGFTGDVAAADVHEIFAFTEAFVAGVPTTEPLVGTGSWVGAVSRGDQVVGVLWVWKPDGGPATMQGYGDDVVLGTALAEVDPAEFLVEDAPSGSWYAWDGRTVRPLNDWARDTLPEPAGLAEAQRAVAAQAALREQQSAGGTAGAPWAVAAAAGAAIALLVAAGVAVTTLRRRRAPS